MSAKPPAPASPVREAVQRALVAAAVSAALFLGLLAFGPFDGVGRVALAAVVAIPTGALLVAVPRLRRARAGARIDDSLPLFITHFGVLATTNLPRQDLLRMLSDNPEYAEAAAEMRRILRLTSEWGLGLADAVRAVAETTPSKLFSGFLRRMAHALEAGQPLEAFLMGEQSVVMQEYASLYQANLLKVDNWKEMYTNAVMTVGFMAVFAAVIPLLGGGDTLLLTLGVALTAVVLEVMLGMMLKERLPRDRLCPNRPIPLPEEARLRYALMGATVLAVLLAGVGFASAGVGGALLAGAAAFVAPGILALRHERAIRRREADYPAFIRSVGAAAAARGGALRDVLGAVQANKLGGLADAVRSLHRRLSWGIDDAAAWRRFGAESGSRLVDSFSTMFVQGVAAGGKPGPISQILSDNMLRILALRTSRRATAGAFRGMLLGLAGGLALVLFMGSGIFDSLLGIFGEHADVLAQQGVLEIPKAGASQLAQDVLFVVVAVHGVAAGIFFKQVEGGRMEGAALHAALQAAIGVGVGMSVVGLMPSLLKFG